MQQAQVLTFRGIWRAGVYYHAGDIVARGPFCFEALVDHVAGTQAEPRSGASWGQYWKPSDGVVAGGGAPASLTLIQFPNAAPAPQVPAVVPVALPAPQAAPIAAPIAPMPAIVSPPPPPQLPARIGPDPSRHPAASEIADDSETGGMNVAFALDGLRKQVGHLVRRDELQAVLNDIARRLEMLEGRTPAALPQTDDAFDAVAAEAWRRKCELLQAQSISAARVQIDGMTREMVRLLRKRDKGGAFTPLEASRIAILDVLDQYIADIDARAAELALETPPDITADRHWPQMGFAS